MSAIQQVLLAAGDQLRLDVATYLTIGSGAATTRLVIDSDGFLYSTNGAGVLTQRYAWVKPASSAPKYDVQWSLVSDTLPDVSPVAQNTNTNLGTDREWQETNNLTTERTVIQLRIYPTGITVNPIVSANITLDADGTP
jgi:hypothetical protein